MAATLDGKQHHGLTCSRHRHEEDDVGVQAGQQTQGRVRRAERVGPGRIDRSRVQLQRLPASELDGRSEPLGPVAVLVAVVEAVERASDGREVFAKRKVLRRVQDEGRAEQLLLPRERSSQQLGETCRHSR
jgi:hypothetical protein